MKQLELDYQAHNYTDTSKSAWENKKNKLTKREQVYEYIFTSASTNYELSEMLDMPLSSVCARVRELQLTDHIEDKGCPKLSAICSLEKGLSDNKLNTSSLSVSLFFLVSQADLLVGDSLRYAL